MHSIDRERVALDSSALLSAQRSYLTAAAHLGYVEGYWSTWIVAEVVRKRTEWIASRAVQDRCDLAEALRRLKASRDRLNVLIDELSRDLRSTDYHDAPPVDLSWLSDQDDRAVVQTALAAGATILVTNNSRDFPLGERRNGVLFLHSRSFLARLFDANPDCEARIREYLSE